MEQDYKPKKYYSLNLTEGRILIIFIFVILFITIITFCVTFLFFSNNKVNDLKVRNLESQNNQTENNINADYSKYDLLSETQENLTDENSIKEEAEINDADKGSEKYSIAEINEAEKSESSEEEIIEKNNNDIIKKDDTEILYSSKYNQANKNEIKKMEAKEAAYKGNSIKQKKYDTRYIVQIGSFASKKTAEDISQFYKKKGYSAFIVTKDYKGRTFFRLRVGPFREKEQAVKYLNEIKKIKYGENSYLSAIYI